MKRGGERRRDGERERSDAKQRKIITLKKNVEEKRIKICSMVAMHRVIPIAVHEKEQREKNTTK